MYDIIDDWCIEFEFMGRIKGDTLFVGVDTNPMRRLVKAVL
jgi:hypothetical protein